MERCLTPKGSEFYWTIVPATFGQATKMTKFQRLERCWGDDCMKMVLFDQKSAPNLHVRSMMKAIGWRPIPGEKPGQEQLFECQDCQRERYEAYGTAPALMQGD